MKLYELDYPLSEAVINETKETLIRKVTLNPREFSQEFRVVERRQGARMYAGMVRMIGEDCQAGKDIKQMSQYI